MYLGMYACMYAIPQCCIIIIIITIVIFLIYRLIPNILTTSKQQVITIPILSSYQNKKHVVFYVAST